MTILVTGGAGYIGSHMVLELLAAGRDVVVLDDLSAGSASLAPLEAIFYRGDCGDVTLLKKIMEKHEITSVIHFAGSIVIPDSVNDPLDYYLNNTVKTRSLLAAMVANGVKRFIFSSTAAVYGDAEENPIPEEAALTPISPYGASKLMTEMMLKDAAAAYDLTYVVLRYFNVAGADPKARSGQISKRATHLIKIASQAALGQRPSLEVFGTDYPTADGTCLRDYIHVGDLARAHFLALQYLEAGEKSTVFNCGYGRGHSVLEVIDAVKRVSGHDFPVRFAARRAGDPAMLIAACDRIRAMLGWKPELDDLDIIVEHALQWEEKRISIDKKGKNFYLDDSCNSITINL